MRGQACRIGCMEKSIGEVDDNMEPGQADDMTPA